MKLLNQPQVDNWEPFVFFENEFSPSECETIINLGKALPPNPALIGGDANAVVDRNTRSSELRWMTHTKQTKWIYEKLGRTVASVQKNWYRFHLSGFAEPLQITHYKAEEGGKYDMHHDFGAGHMSTRKLSLVMLLNPAADFEGGALEVLSIPGAEKDVKKLTQGTVIAFPSWELHRVLPITKGERWSLVCWVHGPPFA
jgi:PKHD-type hydroxylase